MADNGNGTWGGNGQNTNSSSDITFGNVNILDATGAAPYSGEVTVSGNRIKSITRSGGGYSFGQGNGQRIDCHGMTLMPGLIDAHLHLSWNNAPGINPIQMMPIEEHILNCVEMAKIVLDAGFTSGRGAAAAKIRLDVVIRDAINAGRFPGPRYTAAGPEITTVGGLGDATLPHITDPGLNLGIPVSGPEEVRRTVRELIKWGVDTIKLNLSGEEITGMPAKVTQFSDEEVAMAVNEARRRGKTLAAHARSKESIMQCVKYGIEFIYHASFSDEESLDALEAVKDRHIVAPGLAWLLNTARNAGDYGVKPGSAMAEAYERELEAAIDSMKKMHARGIRVLIGGDYGFAWTPHGTNAKDIEYFVDLLGMSPMEAIQAATLYGGQIMEMGDELGTIREGCLADLLLVDGDPLRDVRILQDRNRIKAIMKDGKFHKAPQEVSRPGAYGLSSDSTYGDSMTRRYSA
ncbi:MAG: dipeptidase [marine bacterium B5-7]|nr:MAG: dipeptidase [marine bacterium B5-7]